MLNGLGTVRLIDPSLASSSLMSHCTSLETKVTWNQQGQKGDPGPTGPASKNGAPGKDGVNGRDGVSAASADAETAPAGTSASASFDPTTGNIHLRIPQGPTGAPGSTPAGHARRLRDLHRNHGERGRSAIVVLADHLRWVKRDHLS